MAPVSFDVAHALLRAASTLVSLSANRRDESRRSRQERPRHVGAIVFSIPADPGIRRARLCLLPQRRSARAAENRHGNRIELADAQSLLKAHPRLTAESNGYKYLIERKDGVSTYTGER